MAKTKTKKNGSGKRTKTNTVLARAGDILDDGARRWRALLADPCNGPLTGSCFSGGHTGQYRRVRAIFNIPATEVEGIYVFQPSINGYWAGGHSAAGAGGNITTVGSVLLPTGATPVSEQRCIAACLKVRYTGAEQARAGVLGMSTGTPPIVDPNSALGVGAVSVLNSCTVIRRLGETAHEVKWVPSSGDESYGPPSQNGTTSLFWNRQNSTMTVVFTGVPAGSLQFEITMVLETDSSAQAYGPASSVACSSRNTLNQVIRSLGPVTSWAFEHGVMPVIRSAATGVMQTVSAGMRAATTQVPLLGL